MEFYCLAYSNDYKNYIRNIVKLKIESQKKTHSVVIITIIFVNKKVAKKKDQTKMSKQVQGDEIKEKEKEKERVPTGNTGKIFFSRMIFYFVFFFVYLLKKPVKYLIIYID